MPRGKSVGKQRYTPRRRGDAEESQASSWLTTYADAVTLLLAFFVMLFAMSSTDAAKFEQMARSMRAAIVGTDGALPATSGLVGDASPMPPAAPVSPEVVPDLVPNVPTAPEPEREDEADEAFEGADALAERIHHDLSEQGLLDIAEVEATPDAVTVRVRTDEVLFATGSAEVQPVARTVLSALAPSLRSISKPLRIEGHTDDVPIGTPDYTNWNLSADRAVAVLSLLVDEHGVDPRRLQAVGFGEHAPLVANTSPANRRANRRVEIIIQADADRAVPPAGDTAASASTTTGGHP